MTVTQFRDVPYAGERRLRPDLEARRLRPRPCPFCGSLPKVYPTRPEIEGNAFGQVRCENQRCAANPVVNDGALIADERGPDKYKELAIRRWNRRR